jgi:CubicO group peptidase (beta-lactamase class C family)
LLVATTIVLAVTLATSSLVLAQTPQGPSGTRLPAPSVLVGSIDRTSGESSASRGPTDSQEVEAFLDNRFARQLKNHNIPGATVLVVKDGKVLFAKGYGMADVEAKEGVRYTSHNRTYANGRCRKMS